MMSETLESVAIDVDHKELAEQLLAQAKEQGVELVGPNGLLNQLTKNVLETALDAEMTEHLGYDKHDSAGRGSGNSRNGTRSKTVFTEIGQVELDVPRDTNSTFDPEVGLKSSVTRGCSATQSLISANPGARSHRTDSAAAARTGYAVGARLR